MWARIECYGEYPAVFTCENLSVIENYQGLTEVGDSMFSGTKLTSFDIGENMRLGNDCFFYCWSLQEFNVAEGESLSFLRGRRALRQKQAGSFDVSCGKAGLDLHGAGKRRRGGGLCVPKQRVPHKCRLCRRQRLRFGRSKLL